MNFLWASLCSVLCCSKVQATAEDLSVWKSPEIILKLQTGKVIAISPMRTFLKAQGKRAEFEGNVFLITLDNGLKAVFKSCPREDLGDTYAEVAAYKASTVLGFPNIPPTIMAQIQGMHGSLQLFIDTALDALVPGVYEETLEQINQDDLANLKIFYFVFGQWDTGPHNILISENKGKRYLVAIDNSGIRNHQQVQYGELPFVRVCYSENLDTHDWGQPFPFHKAQIIHNPTSRTLKQKFGERLPQSFYRSFKSYGQPLRYVIYQNSLWRQFHAFDRNYIKTFYASHCPTPTREILKKLDMSVLKKIFSHAQGADFLTEAYLRSILTRRDQLLKHTAS